MPRDLEQVSSHSVLGSESATMPAPTWIEARPPWQTTVRMVMQESRLPEYETYPTAPPYGPRRVGSSSSMISMARIFGAPVSVPAGTLTGAPKIRAMEIIEELEPTRRGPYGGAVGYISYSGNLDSCITIRTVVCHGRRASIQVGAGIVADSDPKTEWLETASKARGMILALRIAAQEQPG